MSRPIKRSLTVMGHRTSVSLEEEFWTALHQMAARRGSSIARLVAEIDRARPLDTGLATSIRLRVLADLTERLQQSERALKGPSQTSTLGQTPQ